MRNCLKFLENALVYFSFIYKDINVKSDLNNIENQFINMEYTMLK